MPRSTELIRDVLVHWLMLRWIEQEIPAIRRSGLGRVCIVTILDSVHAKLLSEIQRSKSELRQTETQVLAQHLTDRDIRIEYKEHQHMYQANYPIPILVADAKAGLIQQLQEVYPK